MVFLSVVDRRSTHSQFPSSSTVDGATSNGSGVVCMGNQLFVRAGAANVAKQTQPGLFGNHDYLNSTDKS